MSSKGYTADLYIARPRIVLRAGQRRGHIGLAVGLVVALTVGLGSLIASVGPSGPALENGSSDGTMSSRPVNSGYQLKTYVLWHTDINSAEDATSIVFDESELPFRFDTLVFGDFRLDANCSANYFGGMSLLVDASGASANLTFREYSGNVIQELEYEGQPLIVLSGWEALSRDSDGSVIEHIWGSMQIVAYDWKEGRWKPSGGIVVNHPKGFTVVGARLCVMVFEPVPSTEIPEFRLAPVCMMAAALMMLIGRRLSRTSILDVPC